MRLVVPVSMGLAFFGLGAVCPAQVQPATTVQLPTISVFNVQTTVSVPDSGGAYLGGVNRAASGSTVRGPLIRNRGIGSTRTASGVSAHATIIDHAEMDRALLAEAAASRPPVDSLATKADVLSKSVARSDSASPAASVAAIRDARSAGADARASELAGYFAKGQQAETDGRIATAKVFYQMVARGDRGQLGQQAQTRLAALGQSAIAAQAISRK